MLGEVEIIATIAQIFNDTLGIAPPPTSLDLIEAALLDSLALVTLLFELEQELGMQMPLETLEIEDLRSVEAIAGVVMRLQGKEEGSSPEAGPRGPVGDGQTQAAR